MTDQELEEFRAAIQRLREERGNDPAKAFAMLVDEGIYTPDGELAEPYRS